MEVIEFVAVDDAVELLVRAGESACPYVDASSTSGERAA
jgi:hypothetical protein